MTLPVTGQLEDGTETFSGKATGDMDMQGTMHLTSSKGAVCDGTFVYTTSREGKGTFHCADGRSGPFSFVSAGSKGTGTGTLGGAGFTFTFG